MEQKQFVTEIANKLQKNKCDLFVGSGISAPSGLPTWGAFLQGYLADMKIKLREADDLPLLAQYIVNQNSGNRNIISEAVFNAFGGDYPLNSYHAAIANFPVKTIWTTNYDSLLEKAFADHKIRVISSENDFLHPYDPTELEIIKLHGCAKTSAQEIILTRADYDCFLYNKPKIAQHLREALIERSLLFLGYSYHDPNIHAIMTQAYQMMGKFTHMHYILTDAPKRKKTESKMDFLERKKRFQYWILELRRIGICELCVPRDEVNIVLDSIAEKARGNTVFVTGGHIIDNMTKDYARRVGKCLAQIPSVILNSGQSTGVGSVVLSAFLEHVLSKQQDINKRIRVFPNPYAVSPAYGNDLSLISALKQVRAPLIADSTFVMLFPGGFGTKAEAELACAKGRLVLPVVLKKSDYNTEAIVYILDNAKNTAQLKKKIPDYCHYLKQRRVPSPKVILKAIKEIINE